ncbi:hypothetical protein [uncultured Sulfitobacter sp.]|uniref:hypothetical protein n=1 Tax=uncultured Sulfitobacter sp. TaxID=191468 RepID=UPI00260CB2A2|nr:hypothetical protein [uncultured Sulfitobacter sp.]
MTRNPACAFSLGVAACVSTGVSASDTVQQDEKYKCFLSSLAATGGEITEPPSMDDYTPFGFLRMSVQKEPNRFGFVSSLGTTVGIGERQAAAGPNGRRWVITNWRSEHSNGPQLTLATFFESNAILVSVAAGGSGHVTFEGMCEVIE